MARYHEVYDSWQRNPEEHWIKAAEGIDWYRRWERVFDESAGVYGRWFVGAECNTCYNAVDRHVDRGRAQQLALIHDSSMTGKKRYFTYRDLKSEISALASVLSGLGVEKGDTVVIYMPVVPEAVFAMLACARLGAVHAVVFGGFASEELAARIRDAEPKVIISASCGLEPGRVIAYKPLLDEAIEASGHLVRHCIVLQRPELECVLKDGRDVDYKVAVDGTRGRAECVPVLATDPLYILYTSGTTGKPKGVVRDNGGHMVMLEWSMQNEFGIKPGEVFWTASDIGWAVGHSYMVYGPLLHGCTTVLFEGKPVGTPDAGTFWRVISEHGVVSLFTAPTAFRAIKGQDPEGGFVSSYDLSSLRALFLAGERADPDTIRWAERHLQVPVIDHWWQTETGSPISHNPMGLGLLPIKHGSAGVPMPGYDVRVLDDAGSMLPPDTLGNVVVKLPLPPGCLPMLWKDDRRFQDTYLTEFPGYYKTADAGYIDGDGYIFVMARTDDVINVAGHRLSTGAMEEVVSEHPDVAECAVIGIHDSIKGQVPCGFIVLNSGARREPSLVEKEVIGLVRERIGAIASPRMIITVKRLPKTRSGKILRGTIRKIADGETWTMPATIEDAAPLHDIEDVIHGRLMLSK